MSRNVLGFVLKDLSSLEERKTKIKENSLNK